MRGKLWLAMRGALHLDGPALRRWQDLPGSLGWGLALLLAVSLLVSAAQAAGSNGAQRPVAERERQQEAVESLADTLSQSPLSTDAQYEVTSNLAAWLGLRHELEGLPRPLGRQVSRTWLDMQRALALPYRRLALWLPYSLLVLAVARALGGRGTLTGLLSVSALYVVPHLLDILRPLPILGPLLGMAAFVWGAAIYVRATAVVNDLDTPRALLAVALPGLVVVTLGLVLLAGVAVYWRVWA